MLNLVSLLVAAALVSLQCGFEANAQLDVTDNNMDNSLQPNVITPPKRQLKKYVHISLAPPETIQHVGPQPLVLECQVFGSPLPGVTWLRNGELVSDLEEDSNEIIAPHPKSIARLTSKLVVISPANGDVYTCVATAGSKQKTASTTVITEVDPDLLTLQQLLRLPSPPIITAAYNDVLQEMGTHLLLPCRATSGEIFWHDNNGKRVYDNSRMRLLPSGDLLVMGLRWGDMGSFTCTVKNAFGKDTVHSFIYPTKP